MIRFFSDAAVGVSRRPDARTGQVEKRAIFVVSENFQSKSICCDSLSFSSLSLSLSLPLYISGSLYLSLSLSLPLLSLPLYISPCLPLSENVISRVDDIPKVNSLQQNDVIKYTADKILS